MDEDPGRGASPTMKCPIDGEMLVMTERQGVEIDYCPKCRGVWLDRGELDKIIERSAPAAAPQAAVPPPQGGRGEPWKRRKKESFLGELFDF
jgi:hypothetical protein